MDPITKKIQQSKIDYTASANTRGVASTTSNQISGPLLNDSKQNFFELVLPKQADLAVCNDAVKDIAEHLGPARPLRAAEVISSTDSAQLQRSLDKFLPPQRQNTVAGFEISDRCDNSNSLNSVACHHPADNSITVTKGLLHLYRTGELSSVDFGAAIAHELAHANGVGEFCAYKVGDIYAARHGGESRFTNDDEILNYIHSNYTPSHYVSAVIERYNGQLSSEAINWLPGGTSYNEMNVEHGKIPTKYSVNHEQTEEYHQLLKENGFPENTDPDILFGAVQYRYHHHPEEREVLAAFSNNREKLPETLQKELGKFLEEYTTTRESHISNSPSTEADYLTSLHTVAKLTEAQVQLRGLGDSITTEDRNNIQQKLHAAVAELHTITGRRVTDAPLSENSIRKEQNILEHLGSRVENSLREFPLVEQRTWTDEDTTKLHTLEKDMISTLKKLEFALQADTLSAEVKSLEQQFLNQIREFDHKDSLRLDTGPTLSTLPTEFQTTRDERTMLLGKLSLAYAQQNLPPFSTND